jgi:hypothetical protein
MSSSEDDAYLVCMRVENLLVAVPGSTKKRCSVCASAVWVSAASFVIAKKQHLPLLCMQCAEKKAEDDDDVVVQPLTEEQRQEIRDAIERG